MKKIFIVQLLCVPNIFKLESILQKMPLVTQWNLFHNKTVTKTQEISHYF